MAVAQPFPAEAAPCSKTWVANTSGLWSDGVNWSPEGEPGIHHDVCINLQCRYTITLDVSRTVASLALTAPDVTLDILGNGTAGNVTLTVSGSATNHGTVRLSAIDDEWDATLSASLTNIGTLTTVKGSGGRRDFIGTLATSGLVLVDWPLGLTGVITNTGGWILNDEVQDSGAVVFHQNVGVISGPGTLSLLDDTFNYINGKTVAPTRFSRVALNTARTATESAILTLLGNSSTLTGTVSPSTTVVVQGDATAGFAASWVAAGTVNNGTLRLTSTAAESAQIHLGAVHQRRNPDRRRRRRGLPRHVRQRYQHRFHHLQSDRDYGQPHADEHRLRRPERTSGRQWQSRHYQSERRQHHWGRRPLADQPGVQLQRGPGVCAGVSYQRHAHHLRSGDRRAAFTLRGSGSTLAGTISPSTTVSIVGGTATGFGSAWIGPGTINNGTFRLTSTAATSAHIVTLGLFTNAGTLLADAGAGGIRGMAGNVTNTGSITFNQTGILADLTLTNTGSIVLNAPVVGNGNPVTINQNGGSFTGLGALTLTHLAFNYNTGPVTPPVFLTNGTLTISGAAIGGATFTLWGSGSTLTGTISPSTTVVVQGSGADAVVSAAAGLTNLGSITLTSAGGPWGASLTAGGAGLSNSGALNVAAGTGGARALGGHLLNTTAGTFTVGATTTVSTAAASHINQGAVTLAGGTLLTVSGVGAALTNTGTIGGAGSLVLDGVTLNGTGSVTHTLLAGTAAVSPGLPTGQLTMTGSYIHGAGTSLNVSLGGNNPGVTFDQLRVLGTATLTDGTLNVTVSGGFVSCDGAVFDVLTYGARIGTFGTLNGLTIGARPHAVDRVLGQCLPAHLERRFGLCDRRQEPEDDYRLHRLELDGR